MNIIPEVKKRIIIQRESNTSAGKILELIQTYDNLTLEDFPNMDESKRQYIILQLSSQPNAQEQAEWEKIASVKDSFRNEITTAEALRDSLQNYIHKWEQDRPVGNHVDEANKLYVVVDDFILAYWRKIEENAWNSLDINNNNALGEYLKTYPHSSHKAEIDDLYWENINKEILKDVEDYIKNPIFTLHKNDAEVVKKSLVEWMRVKNLNDIFEVSNFIKNNPESPFIDQAKILLVKLKQNEISKMQTAPNAYEVGTLLRFINEGIFTKYELISQDVLTDGVFNTISDPDIMDGLPDIQQAIDNSVPECKEGYTDVYFFGIPSTGKTCILMGLSRANSLHINLAHGGGDYADALQQFIDAGLTVPQTKMGFAATLEATINDRQSNSQHKINLIEMAGEDFAKKIAGNQEHIYDFDSMGTGVTDLLKNNNKKVFFLIIDPTTNVINYKRRDIVGYDEETGDPIYDLIQIRCNQQNLITKLVDLFAYEGNAEIMKKVDSIHVIVTKADLLGADTLERDDKALQIFNTRYGNNILDPLIDLCKEYNINVHNNYHPKLYTFSLGKFYVGGVYEYDSTDSNKLVNAIKNSTGTIKKKTLWDKVKEKIN